MTKKILIYSTLLIVVAAAALWANHLFNRSSKIGWMDLPKVYDQFAYKKQLQKELESRQLATGNQIDSIEMELSVLSNLMNEDKGKESLINEHRRKGNMLLMQKKKLEEQLEEVRTDFHNKITMQLNQYVRDYAESQNYDLVLSADGSGILMYGEGKIELTDNIIAYINKRYMGEPK
ncbi:MAG: OmpH family outer membrane protein [Bacteroidia bacterium]|nr:OmpH family outer membrane protein [Bacteroidia bacterium]